MQYGCETFRLMHSTRTGNGDVTDRVFGIWLVAIIQEQLYNLGLLVFGCSV
jgi:hypothetical protein